METMNIILWVMGAGFSIQFGLMMIIWNRINSLAEDVKDIDRRLCRIEGAMSVRDDG